jgi:branched-chain amino acid transport system ATP-binding protein
MRSPADVIGSGGQCYAAQPSHRFCRQGIALVPEGRRLFTRMSVEENLDIGSYPPEARRARREAIERVYGLFPILRDRRRQAAGSLSGGQQQMLTIGRALMARRRLLLLDEPSLGLAPAIVDQMFDAIGAIHEEGVAILLVEQNVAKALELAERAYVLEEGRTVAEGSPAALLTETRVQEPYLGFDEP